MRLVDAYDAPGAHRGNSDLTRVGRKQPVSRIFVRIRVSHRDVDPSVGQVGW